MVCLLNKTRLLIFFFLFMFKLINIIILEVVVYLKLYMVIGSASLERESSQHFLSKYIL